MRRPWNSGKRTRIYSRKQYGFLKHNKSETLALEMLTHTHQAGQTLASLPKSSKRRA